MPLNSVNILSSGEWEYWSTSGAKLKNGDTEKKQMNRWTEE